MTAAGGDGSDPVDDDPLEEDPLEDDHLEEIRQAAGAVVASLKWLVEATERVIDDPGAFSQVVDSGRGVVDSFLGGFMAHAGETGPADGSAGAGETADGGDFPPES